MQKIINFDDLTKENIEEKFEYPRRSGSGKTNLLFNLILIKSTYMLKIHMNQNTNF